MKYDTIDATATVLVVDPVWIAPTTRRWISL
jgi:hypothetical protein